MNVEFATVIELFVFIAIAISVIVLPIFALIDIVKSQFIDNNKIIWVLVVLLLPLIGSILYFIIGINQKMGRSY